MTLAWISQEDFSAGTVRSLGRTTDVGVGVWNAVNGFFDDEGDCYRRGGVRQYTQTAAEPLTFLWTGWLQAPNAVGLAASKTKMYSLDASGALTQIASTGLAGPVQAAVVQGHLYLPNYIVWDGVGPPGTWVQIPPPAEPHQHVAAVAGRLVLGQGRLIQFSEYNNPHSFIADDVHELPAGVEIRGLASIRDTLLVFTGYGIWTVQNMALDLTDDFGNPQQIVSKLSPELALVADAGVAEWAGRIVVPCEDRVYLIDAEGPPVPISDAISPLYMEHIRADRKPGGAKVFRNHYFLPFLDADGSVATVLVCRLNRPVRGRYVYYPWTVLTGQAAQMTMGDISALDSVPRLLGASASGHIISFADVFNPSADVAADADGTAFEFDLETRDFPTGNGQPNHLRKLRLHYTLDGPADAEVDAAISYGAVSQDYEALRSSTASYQALRTLYSNYDAARSGDQGPKHWDPGPWSGPLVPFWDALAPAAFPSPGIDPITWNLARAKRVRYVRARFRCSDPVARLIVHRFDFGVRPATHQR